MSVIVGLLLCYALPLLRLTRFAAGSELYSYILLVPFVSVYLVWLEKRRLMLDSQPVRAWSFPPLIAGLSLLGGYAWSAKSGWTPGIEDYLCVMTLSLLCFMLATSFTFLGTVTLRRVLFPIIFIFFMVPLPGFLRHATESFLQKGSAEVAYWMLNLCGMPVLHQGTRFQMPGFNMEVAPECSGIHSTFVLFITSFLAGYVFLRSPWRRVVLVLAVIPLALLRNGFRVFVISELCVNVDPAMIDSPIHRRGGPIFFVLSLIPFFLLLFALKKWESRAAALGGTPLKD